MAISIVLYWPPVVAINSKPRLVVAIPELHEIGVLFKIAVLRLVMVATVASLTISATIRKR